ncbi:MAG: hypothetical protein PHX13_11615 [Thiovulaceae bacterium]|nr:hypothetical protein [Sulfurimonadaceae bacterium]
MPCRELVDFEHIQDVFLPFNAVSTKNECIQDRNWITGRTLVDGRTLWFNILDKKGNTILGNICCADKFFFAYSGKKYAWINNIRLKPEFKKSKNVKKFSKKWDKKYIEHGISAIGLNAIEDGIIAWHRLGFEYRNITDKTILIAHFADYLNEVKNIVLENIDLKQVDSSYFFDEIHGDFTQWIKTRGFDTKIPMIRRLG